MKLKIIHLEDSVMKHIAISRVIGKMAQVDWVTDMASGIEKIDFSIENGTPYDLAITDMHYSLSPGSDLNDWENELKALLYSMNNFKALDKKEPWKRGDINEKKDKGAAS